MRMQLVLLQEDGTDMETLLQEIKEVLSLQLKAARCFNWSEFASLDLTKVELVEKLKNEKELLDDPALNGLKRELVDLEFQINKKLETRKKTILLKKKALNRKKNLLKNSLFRYGQYR